MYHFQISVFTSESEEDRVSDNSPTEFETISCHHGKRTQQKTIWKLNYQCLFIEKGVRNYFNFVLLKRSRDAHFSQFKSSFVGKKTCYQYKARIIWRNLVRKLQKNIQKIFYCVIEGRKISRKKQGETTRQGPVNGIQIWNYDCSSCFTSSQSTKNLIIYSPISPLPSACKTKCIP